jgi:hypothetical protein
MTSNNLSKINQLSSNSNLFRSIGIGEEKPPPSLKALWKAEERTDSISST